MKRVTLVWSLRAAAFAVVPFAMLYTFAAAAPFQPGPVVYEDVPQELGTVLGFVGQAEVAGGRWPKEVRERVHEALGETRGVLLIGQTDPIGPQSLNRSLGLQQAVQAARWLASEWRIDPTRLAVASRGEVAVDPPGVALYGWQPPAVWQGEPKHLAVLEPLPRVPSRGLFWGIWQGDAEQMLWAREGDPGLRLWEVAPRARRLQLPVPGRVARAALGGSLLQAGLEAEQVAVVPPKEDAELRLLVADVEPGWVRARVRVPAGHRQPLVWADGIPYRLVPDSQGAAEVALARVSAETLAYAQAVDLAGNVVVGPPLRLPDDGSPLPEFVAVLVWEGGGTDLDLHAWDGARHTHPGSPDAAYSDSAVPGVRLLFDGAAWQPASALAGWARSVPEVAIQCYSDLGGNGAVAWLYLVEHPDDPVRERRQIHGPRRLSERELEARWPVLGPAGGAVQ